MRGDRFILGMHPHGVVPIQVSDQTTPPQLTPNTPSLSSTPPFPPDPPPAAAALPLPNPPPPEALVWCAYCDQYLRASPHGTIYGFGGMASAVTMIPILRTILGWLSGTAHP